MQKPRLEFEPGLFYLRFQRRLESDLCARPATHVPRISGARSTASIRIPRKRRRLSISVFTISNPTSFTRARRSNTCPRMWRTPDEISMFASEPTRRLSSFVPMPPPRLSSRSEMLDLPQELLIMADRLFRKTIRSYRR